MASLCNQRKNFKGSYPELILTAGVGSDHIDLAAAARSKITVAEITGSNVVSVAEQVVMHILTLVRNYIPPYKQVIEGRWDIAEIASNAHDLKLEEKKRQGCWNNRNGKNWTKGL